MIPRHSLPFSIGTILSTAVSSGRDAGTSDTEKAFADKLGVAFAVLIPSVRSGIRMAIRMVSRPGLIAVGPAYTCATVHQAMVLSGAEVKLIDTAPDAFLMSPDEVLEAAEPACALLLSELYGLPYDRESLRKSSGKGPAVRILDMAMGIPARERMEQLEARDIALFSFGWGKPMFAGWGGVACFQDPELAGRCREIRDKLVSPETPRTRLRHAWSVALSVLLSQKNIYGLTHQRHLYGLYKAVPSKEDGLETSLRPAGALSPEWTQPMTALNRKLALHNLERAAGNATLRRRQAEMYSQLLTESGTVRGTGSDTLPQSHFAIRVPAALRNKMCDYLRRRGIDTGTLFPFPPGLTRTRYPRAAEVADEVITLPMGPAITLENVRMVSRWVTEGLSTLGSQESGGH